MIKSPEPDRQWPKNSYHWRWVCRPVVRLRPERAI